MKHTKIPAITPELKNAVELYLMAKVIADDIRPVVKGYQQKILVDNQWHNNPKYHSSGIEDKIILDPEDSYQMTEENFQIYHKLCQQAVIDNGLEHTINDPECCPMLTADYTQIQAENLILSEAVYITNMDPDRIYNLDHRAKMLELILKFVFSACPDMSGNSIMKRFAGEPPRNLSLSNREKVTAKA